MSADTPGKRLAEALVACFRYKQQHPGRGAERLFDAVNEAFSWTYHSPMLRAQTLLDSKRAD